MMHGAEKEKYCSGEGGSILLLIFTEKKFGGSSLKLKSVQIGKPLHYKRSEKVYGLENHYIIKGQKKYIDWETFPL